MVASPQIRCQLHDHAKQYDNDDACHNKRNSGNLHGNRSRNGYGNAIIGRYGGYFEEGNRWVYGTSESCVVLERLAMGEVLSFGFNLAVSFPSDSKGNKARIVLLPSRIKRWGFHHNA